jgi:hypothetical protein
VQKPILKTPKKKFSFMILEKTGARVRAESHNIAAYLRLFGYSVFHHRDTVVDFVSQEETQTSSFLQTADFATNRKTLAVSLDVRSPLATQPLHLSIYYSDSLQSCLLLEAFGDPSHVSIYFPALLSFARTHNFGGADVAKETLKQFSE